MVLCNRHVDDAIGVEDVLRNLCLGADLSFRDVHFLVVGSFGTVEVGLGSLESLYRAARLERLFLWLAGVLRYRHLLYLAGFCGENDGAENIGMRVAALFGCGLPCEVRLEGHLCAGLEELLPSPKFCNSRFNHLCEIRSVRNNNHWLCH